MPSLLLVTPDSTAQEQILKICQPYKVRCRAVASVGVATEWLSSQRFDFLLVDAFFGEDIPIELVTLGWKHNPMMVGAIFNLRGPVPNEWYARLLGIRIMTGAKGIENLGNLFEIKPRFESEQRNKVLLVEDLDSPRQIIAAYIEALGDYRVETAAGAEEAVGIVSEHPENFFCVVTDLNMPKVSGIRLIEMIRSSELTAHLPVIVLTAYATDTNLVECVRAGATGFLVKPPIKKSLRQELEKAMRIILTEQSPRLCRPEDAHLLEDALARISLH